MQELAIIALEYLEPEWVQTLKCLKETGLPVFFAKRDGVGNLSRAFNDTFEKEVQERYRAVWFVTNVRFTPETPHRLLKTLRDGGYAAVHPAVAGSDHVHLQPDGTNQVHPVKFVEFIAPLFDADTFAAYKLEEKLWHWYMDLVISHEIAKRGGTLACDQGATVWHTYLRNNQEEHPITRLRRELREEMKTLGQQWCAQQYGKSWKKVLHWKE